MKLFRKDQLQEMANILKDGGLVAFPTETVFGFGVVFDNESSYKRLIEVKRRPPEKPFTMMLSQVDDIEKYAELDEKSRLLIENFMPGQFTLIVKAKKNLPFYSISKDGFVGLRIPDEDTVRSMIDMVGKPLLVPSANRSGDKPLTNSDDVVKEFADEVDAVLEGQSTSNVPSTIVKVSSSIEIIREGLISKEQIDKIINGGKKL